MPARRAKVYVGLTRGFFRVKREIFRSVVEPTEQTHGSKYVAVIGPFRTIQGAIFMRDRGSNNPHVQNVADAERLAKKYK